MQSRKMIIAAVLMLGAMTHPAAAGVWDETTDGGGDAGNLLTTAQITTGVGALTQITGVIPDPEDVDMYCINITSSL